MAKVHDAKWLARTIQIPDQLLDEKDPIATAFLNTYKIHMSNVGVTNEDVQLIIGFLQQQTAARDKQAATATAAQKARLSETASEATNK